GGVGGVRGGVGGAGGGRARGGFAQGTVGQKNRRGGADVEGGDRRSRPVLSTVGCSTEPGSARTAFQDRNAGPEKIFFPRVGGAPARLRRLYVAAQHMWDDRDVGPVVLRLRRPAARQPVRCPNRRRGQTPGTRV